MNTLLIFYKDILNFVIHFWKLFISVDEILHDVGSIIEVHKENGKSHIVVNQELLHTFKEQGKSDSGTDLSLFGIKIGGSLKKVKDQSSDWLNASKSLDDQVMSK